MKFPTSVISCIICSLASVEAAPAAFQPVCSGVATVTEYSSTFLPFPNAVSSSDSPSSTTASATTSSVSSSSESSALNSLQVTIPLTFSTVSSSSSSLAASSSSSSLENSSSSSSSPVESSTLSSSSDSPTGEALTPSSTPSSSSSSSADSTTSSSSSSSESTTSSSPIEPTSTTSSASSTSSTITTSSSSSTSTTSSTSSTSTTSTTSTTSSTSSTSSEPETTTSTTSSLNTSAPTSTSSSAFSFADTYLAKHNYFRGLMQNTDPLSWNDDIAQVAQNYANKYQCGADLEHSGNPYGENLARGFDFESAGAVAAWFDEIKYYNWDNPGFGENTGHFTQLVWTETTQLGCGYKDCGSYWGTYIVCNYNPAGNVALAGGDDAEYFYRRDVQKPIDASTYQGDFSSS